MKGSRYSRSYYIPESWACPKLCRLVKFYNGDRSKNYPNENELVEYGVPFINAGDLVNGNLSTLKLKYITHKKYISMGGAKIVEKDIAFCLRGTIGKNAYLKIGEGTLASSLMVIRCNGIDSRYLYYVINSDIFTNQNNIYTNGTAQPNLSAWSVGQYNVPLPNMKMQIKISDILDNKVSLIDSIIEKTKQSIEEYKKYKQSLITETVTKGLNPDAPLKDSGIEWIGKIPTNWKMARLKDIGDAFIGLTYSPVNLSDKGTLVLRSSNVKAGKIIYTDNKYVNIEVKSKYLVLENDILICSRNGSRKLIGKNALIDKNTAGHSFGAFMTIFRSPYNQFIYYILNSSIFSYHIGTFLTATINQLTLRNLNSIKIPIPPVDEQEQIVKYLKHKCNEIDRILEIKEQMVIQFEFYKKSLIFEYVTGKKEVQ